MGKINAKIEGIVINAEGDDRSIRKVLKGLSQFFSEPPVQEEPPKAAARPTVRKAKKKERARP